MRGLATCPTTRLSPLPEKPLIRALWAHLLPQGEKEEKQSPIRLNRLKFHAVRDRSPLGWNAA
ncbi:hypothetical protein EGK63_04390 [Brevundimonas sp. 357]|nr:hypothetical protein EGK63_04390 [Brevundimonas sp. 357]